MKGGKALITRVGDSDTVVEEWTQCGSEALDSFQGLLPLERVCFETFSQCEA
jgi:hypothetical protein